MKHFFEICLNLSFGVTMKLPGSSACDMTELGCSWPTAMIIRHCCWESGRGWGTILKENHAALCMGEVTPWNWILPSLSSRLSLTLNTEPGLLKYLFCHKASPPSASLLVTCTYPTPSGLAGNILECLQANTVQKVLDLLKKHWSNLPWLFHYITWTIINGI